ncbi:hsp70-Hsp90 organizing protein-like isoform X2 [Echeneis naucrates]|uniref:hsp70-Hsp90 organizing protein-like isoform X2 n=1 Tax=Echeneis naucrates TaxID=173247 RepID=UPI0011135C18|nr:hsp70-Hsp90 organizing protein-like isoform X2 [Echeneis naucrates]
MNPENPPSARLFVFASFTVLPTACRGNAARSKPMKFPRDICRLLGLGGDGPGEEEMAAQGDAPNPTDKRRGQDSSQSMLSNDEGPDDDDDEERARRKAERKRAKKKRQKERKKLEREERMEDLEQEEEVSGAASDSNSEEEFKVDEKKAEVHPRNKCSPESVSALMTAENKSNRQLPHRTSDEEPEWDVSSAFVANAASHIRLKGLKNRAVQVTRENKENEAKSSQGANSKEMKTRGESLAEQGIQMFKQGQYSQAVDMFTEAIHCDPRDHRFYGNRSYCYWCLDQYSSALTDAQRSIDLAPDWPKGYFRKGCALMGLKRYSEAEKEMEQVLKLDQNIKEASSELITCQILQLTEMGLEAEQSKLLLEKFSSVQAVLTSSEVKALKQTPLEDQSGSCRSLWVGNITLEVTDRDLWDLFKMFGEIESIRVLHERFCAFVNFKNANMAARALEKLQGVELGSRKLVMRYPDRWIQRSLPSLHRTNSNLSSNAAGTQQSSASTGSRPKVPINGDECFYWRTSGCVYGDKCRFKHIADQQGRNRKPWQP